MKQAEGRSRKGAVAPLPDESTYLKKTLLETPTPHLALTSHLPPIITGKFEKIYSYTQADFISKVERE